MREAESLYSAGHGLGAIYLYGYVIEISLKAAYYRIIGLVPTTLIDTRLHRGPAQQVIRNMQGLPTHPQGAASAGHNLIGWARLLEQERANSMTPLAANFATQLHRLIQDVFECWAEFLRYRANRLYDQEVETVRHAAMWIRRRYSALWS